MAFSDGGRCSLSPGSVFHRVCSGVVFSVPFEQVAIATALYKEGFLLVVDDDDEDEDEGDSSEVKPRKQRVAPSNGTSGRTSSVEPSAGDDDGEHDETGVEEEGDDGL